MKEYWLPADYCRCDDGFCTERTECLRWLTRDTGNARAASLRSVGVEYKAGDECPWQIEPGEEHER